MTVFSPPLMLEAKETRPVGPVYWFLSKPHSGGKNIKNILFSGRTRESRPDIIIRRYTKKKKKNKSGHNNL